MKATGLCFVLVLASCTPAALTTLDSTHPGSPQAAEASAAPEFKALGEDAPADQLAREPVLPPAGEPRKPKAHSHGGHGHDH